jgi:hypothetical protein
LSILSFLNCEMGVPSPKEAAQLETFLT